MPTPQKRPALSGATRRGHYRQVAGVPTDQIAAAMPPPGASGITELTGDVTAGPGSGAVAATIGANKVTTVKILDANVTTPKIADDAITTAKILAANVTTVKIADANVTTAKIADAAVTSAKLRDSAATSVIGRSANSSGVPADIVSATNGHVLQRLAGVLGFSALDISGIADGSLTLAKLVDLAALSVLGRAANTSGVMAAITAGSDGDVLRRLGTALGFGQIATAGIADAAVTLAKLANLATQTVHGRNTAGTGVPEAVTLTQLLDWIGSATTGDILVRGASSWQRLAAPAIGFFLGGNGAATLPSYQGVTGFAHPLAQASHLEYVVNLAGAFINTHGGSGSITATAQGYPAAGSILAAGAFYKIATAASTSSTATLTSQSSGTNKELSFAWDFDVTYEILTDAAAVTSVRYLVGVGINNEDADTVPANYIGFRFSTSAGDTGWVGIVFDGTQAVTATIASIAANTRYAMRIRKVAGTVFFSINGGAEVSQATHVPVNNVYASIVMRVTALTTSIRALWFSRLWCDYGT